VITQHCFATGAVVAVVAW